MTNHTPHQIIDDGLSYVPANRLGTGLVGNLPISSNLILKDYRKSPLSKGPFLNRTSIGQFAERLIGAFQITTPSAERPVRLLSGGNLQKVILAREITAGKGLLVAVNPTRGLDVGATESVQRTLLEQRAQGAGVLLVSEDLDELLSICDRIAVMYEGRVMGVMPAQDANRDELGLMMAGETLPSLGRSDHASIRCALKRWHGQATQASCGDLGMALKLERRMEPSRTANILVPILSILLALAACGVLLLIVGVNPLETYRAMVQGAFGSAYAISETLVRADPADADRPGRVRRLSHVVLEHRRRGAVGHGRLRRLGRGDLSAQSRARHLSLGLAAADDGGWLRGRRAVGADPRRAQGLS